ncbi:MAG TPA: acyltransferase [Mycobacteriales bacterium]|nr:acyltransferase [Mycobacteriales bacterium]
MSRRRDLDGLRGFAMVGVLGFHSAQIQGGDFGIIIFFVLSGYLICTLLLREHDKAGRVSRSRFYIRRAARLLPALVLGLGGYLALSSVLGDSWGYAAGHVWPAFFYCADAVIAFSTHVSGHVGWAWSLSVEEQFYVIWPAILLFALWRKRIGIAVWIAVAGVIAATVERLVLVPSGPTLLTPTGVITQARIYFAPDTRMDALFVGCLLAILLHRWPKTPSRELSWLLGLAGMGAIAACYAVTDIWATSTYTYWWSICTFGSAAAIYGMVTAPRSPTAILCGIRPVAYLGRISYGVYLWNSTLGLLMGHIVPGASTWQRELLWLTMSIGVAMLSVHLVEQPILRRVGRDSSEYLKSQLRRSAPTDEPATSPPLAIPPQPSMIMSVSARNAAKSAKSLMINGDR